MKHIHHIIPKHMGGTDDPDNLIALSIKDHAEAHKKLYEKFGKQEDYIAWMSLSSQIGKDEIFIQTSSLGGKLNKGKPKDKRHREKIKNAITGTSHSQEVKKKISKSMLGNKNSKNHNSNEYKRVQSQAMKDAWRRRKNSGRAI